MSYALCGFVWGLFIPYIARRFAKFMPATFAYALFDICHCRFSLQTKGKEKFLRLRATLRWRSFMYALAAAVIFYALALRNPGFDAAGLAIFAGASLLLVEIDSRLLLLPDIITYPLLILGFGFACFGGGILPVESFIGAAAGYILPTAAAMFLVWKHKDAFGGGDVKYLAVIGAWLGLEKLLYVIIGACIIFAVYALAARKRAGAFGPALALAAIGAAFI